MVAKLELIAEDAVTAKLDVTAKLAVVAKLEDTARLVDTAKEAVVAKLELIAKLEDNAWVAKEAVPNKLPVRLLAVTGPLKVEVPVTVKLFVTNTDPVNW